MTRGSPPRRGEVWWVAFDPAIGGEIRKTRPAIIISNDLQTANSTGFRS
jgi:mRNA interferase MazF